jgi:carbamate kinase
MKKIVVALGGNALGVTPEEDKRLVKHTAKQIAQLIKQGHHIMIAHGNGPQVGMIFNTFAAAAKVDSKTPNMPFAEAGAMSQGYIGYHLMTAIYNECTAQNIRNDVNYVLALTIVDKNDPAFQKPTKPVGPFYKTLEEAKQQSTSGSTIIEDAGRGYRKVVASPKPIGFIGIDTIQNAFENSGAIIAGGGGGVPMIVNADGTCEGVDGVIDKDLTSAKLAELVGADELIILTAVSKVCINFNKPNQKELDVVSVKDLEKYIAEGQFAPGSMLPKIQAVVQFVKAAKDKTAIIADLNELEKVLQNKSGTKIIYEYPEKEGAHHD